MINLRDILSLLMETSREQEDRDQKNNDTTFGQDFGGRNVPTPAQQAARDAAGVPKGAQSSGGRWYDSKGEYLGRTINGRFQAKTPDEQEKARSRGGSANNPGDSWRSQGERDRRSQDAERAATHGTPQERTKRAATRSVGRIADKMGFNPTTLAASREMGQLAMDIDGGKLPKAPNPLPNHDPEDAEVSYMTVDDYQRRMNRPDPPSEQEIDAAGRFFSKYATRETSPFPSGVHKASGVPLGVHKGEDGQSYVILRARSRQAQLSYKEHKMIRLSEFI